MAGKAKSVYLIVADLKTHKTVFTKTFFNASDYQKFVKEPEFEQKYPKDQFYYVKESY